MYDYTDYLYWVYQSIKSMDQFTVTLAEQNSNQRLTENAWINPLFVMIKRRLSFVMTHMTDQARKWILLRINTEILKFRFK